MKTKTAKASSAPALQRRKQAPPAAAPQARAASLDYPMQFSIGAAVRQTHRCFIQELQEYLLPHAITPGMWYFFRVLWEEEGLTQRELSERSGTMDPTTVEQLRNMEKHGLIERRRSQADKRKMHVFLTPKGRALKAELLPFAAEVNVAATSGLTDGEIGFLRFVLAKIRGNLENRRASRLAAEAALQPQRKRGRPPKAG